MIPRRALGVVLLLATAAVGAAAPKKGVSLDDLKPKKQPRPTPTRPAPKRPAPKPTAPTPKRPTPVAVKPAPAPAFQVGEGAPFKSIGDALKQAPAGARILVRSGTYRESLVLTRPVEILPANLEDVVTVEGGAQPAVRMQGASATLRRLTLRLGPGAGQTAYTVEIPQGKLLLDDCSIDSGAKACVGVTGEKASPTLRQCRLQGGKDGFQATDRGQATLEGCSLSRNGGAGLVASGGAKVTLRGCRIAENSGSGLLFQDGAQGTVDDCDVTANQEQGAQIRTGANPSFIGTRFFRNPGVGLIVREAGQGQLTNCDLFENSGGGLRISGGAPTIRGCKFRANQGDGVAVGEKGGGTIEDSEVSGNTKLGVVIKGESRLTVRAMRVISKSEDAVHVAEKSRGTFEGCELSKGPGAAVIAVHGGSVAEFRKCRVTAGFWGALASPGTELTLDDCDLSDTAGPAVRLDGTKSASITRSRISRSPIGLEADKGSEALVEDTTFTGGTVGVRIVDGAKPTLRRCIIRDNAHQGVWVDQRGAGLLDRCEIFGQGWCGIGIHSGGNTTVRGCKIYDSRGENGKNGIGIEVSFAGLGTIEDCELTGHRSHGLYILLDGAPTVRRCKIYGNGGGGITLGDKGKGSVTATDVYKNTGGSVVRTGAVATVLRDCRTD